MAREKNVNRDALTEAIVFFCELVRDTMNKLPDLTNKYDRERTAHELEIAVRGYFGLEQDSKILSMLYGFYDGYLYSYEGAALLLGVDPEKVERVHHKWRSHCGLTCSLSLLRTRWLKETPCKGCGVKFGEVHKFGCVNEECPYCHGMVWSCLCSYRVLKLGWGGRTPKEWRVLRKQHGSTIDRTKYVRPLTHEEQRNWGAAVMKKGAVPYGKERKFL